VKPLVLIVTLSMSRYQFVWPTFTQTVESLCEGLDAAWLSSAALFCVSCSTT
jgi:hypothetical protein